MQMRSGTMACISTKSDQLSCFEKLTYFHFVLTHVSIQSFQTVIMSDQYIITKTTWIVTGNTDDTVKTSHDRITNVQAYIGTIMPAVPAVTKATGGAALHHRHRPKLSGKR